MLQLSDFREGLPVIIEGREADILYVGEMCIIAESLRPIEPGESRYASWTIEAAQVLSRVVYDAERDFVVRGSVLCHDCGSRVCPETLASLPPHGCIEKQRARAEVPGGA